MQDPGTRSHITDFTVISAHEFSLPATGLVGTPRSRNSEDRRPREELHLSELILSLTNFWFIRKHQENRKPVEATPKDLHASLKIASTLFKSPQANPAKFNRRDHYFDKNGLIVPYPALQALLADDDFAAYLKAIKQKYEDDVGSNDGDDDDVDDDGSNNAHLLTEEEEARELEGECRKLTDEEEEELLSRAAERAERRFREKIAGEKRKAGLNNPEVSGPSPPPESEDDRILLEALRIVKRRKPSPIAVDLQARFQDEAECENSEMPALIASTPPPPPPPEEPTTTTESESGQPSMPPPAAGDEEERQQQMDQ